MTLLTPAEREDAAAHHPNWQVDPASMTRTFEFSDFNQAMGFVNRVALRAERLFHHPGIDVRWNRVTLTLSTHSEGGLTRQDLELAGWIDAVVD